MIYVTRNARSKYRTNYHMTNYSNTAYIHYSNRTVSLFLGGYKIVPLIEVSIIMYGLGLLTAVYSAWQRGQNNY